MPKITVAADVHAPIEAVWELWTSPQHIEKWNDASDDWHTPHAESDLRPGGIFLSRMEAKDGSGGFDFTGTFDVVQPPTHLAYTLEDGRHVSVEFSAQGDRTHITERFDAEDENSLELQESGWQSILDNFKNYAEDRPL